ncbi:hypothetical protein V6C53_05025 [Desulfocurvibacter africanus]|uniref:hypothetical protein n=1 Tax=Desulfocurvibacter africanus TaxID=873 RepID=UPI002FDAB6EB
MKKEPFHASCLLSPIVLRLSRKQPDLKHFAFQTLPSALTAELHSAYACGAASHADAWLAEHFQKQNALKHSSLQAIDPSQLVSTDL